MTSPHPALVEARTTSAAPSLEELGALVDATLEGRFSGLRFPPALEDRYRADMAGDRLRTLLIAGTLVAFVMNFFLISDRAMLPDVFEQAVLWRAWVFTPVCLVGMWLMSRIPHVLLRELMALSAGMMACGIHVYLATISHSPHTAAYLTGLAMVILYCNVFVRCGFWMALPSTLAVLALYVASLWWVPHHSMQLSVSIGLVLIATAQFTLYNLYTLEHQERHNYLMTLRQRLLQRALTHANQELERVSRYDGLTQVANRRHFDEFMARVWERARANPGQELSVIMVDVDHFKAYNDHYGHPGGDACLVQVAEAVQRCLRRPGDLVARYGGEEFIAVLNRTTHAHALAAAGRVREAVEALGLPHGAPFTHGRVTVSVGVATVVASDRQASIERLISAADQALYQAKNRGRNRVWPAQTPLQDQADRPSTAQGEESSAPC